MTFVETDRDVGRVITGSSNFSQSGLAGNLEFNVELKNRADYEFALAKFNELWADGVEVTSEYVETIKHKSHLALFSPHEIYLKFLYEYFRTELSQPRELEQDYQPPGFKRLQYQQDAVLTAKRIAEEYGGVFLADVVGLGKTYMAAMLARELEGRSLVIAPPALVDENNPGAWGNVLYDFGVRGFKAYSIGRLDQILKLDLSKFHKLFQDSRNSSLPNLPNLDNFFRNLNNLLRPLDRVTDRGEYLRVMRENAREVRERILKYLMVRLTRGEISRFYAEDLATQNLKFPEVASPTPVFYELSKRENEIFTSTIERITNGIAYARYRPLTYFQGKLERGHGGAIQPRGLYESFAGQTIGEQL